MTDTCAPTARKWGGTLERTRHAGPIPEAAQALEDQVREVIAAGPSGPGALIPLLQLVQEGIGYLPAVSFGLLSAKLGLPESRIYGVVTFYAQFHLKPRGKYVVRVCQGTACHVRGGKIIGQAVEEELGVKSGDTTPDLLFTLERVACLGACGLAPTMIINDATYGRLTPAKAQKILADLAKGGPEATRAEEAG